MNRNVSLALAALVLAGCASPATTTGDSASADANACINPSRIKEQKILSDQEIQFTLNDGEVWLNRLPYACNGLKSNGGFEWEVRGMSVCSNQERITVLRDGTPCQLGVFTKVADGS
jgi:hypothetical protein